MIYHRPGYGGETVPHTERGYPGTRILLNHLIATHGGRSLGIYGNRPIRGGATPSVHAVARALDWGYDDRDEAVAVLRALTDNGGALAHALGVQAIHDYATRNPEHHDLARTWGHSRDDWHWAKIGSPGSWLHIELTIDAAKDRTLLERVLRTSNSDKVEHHADTDDDQARHIPHPTLRVGSSGTDVVLLQQIINQWHRARPDKVPGVGAADGRFGHRTHTGLIAFQTWPLQIPADGIYGPQTARATQQLDEYLRAQP